MIMIVNFATQLKQEKNSTTNLKARVVKKLRGKAISKRLYIFANTEKKETKTLVHDIHSL